MLRIKSTCLWCYRTSRSLLAVKMRTLGKYALCLFLLLTALFSASPVAAQGGGNHAGLIVVFDEGEVFTECVAFEGELTGYELLEGAGLSVIFEDYGAGLGFAVCKIEDLGRDYPAESCFRTSDDISWRYWYREDGGWVYSGFGASSRTIGDGNVDAWVWGDGTTEPPDLSFADLCAPATETPTEVPTDTALPTATYTPTPKPATSTPTASSTSTPTLSEDGEPMGRRTPRPTTGSTDAPVPSATHTSVLVDTHTPSPVPPTATDTPDDVYPEATRTPLPHFATATPGSYPHDSADQAPTRTPRPPLLQGHSTEELNSYPAITPTRTRGVERQSKHVPSRALHTPVSKVVEATSPSQLTKEGGAESAASGQAGSSPTSTGASIEHAPPGPAGGGAASARTPTPDKVVIHIATAVARSRPTPAPPATVEQGPRRDYGAFAFLVAVMLVIIVYATLLRRQRLPD
jgi:hypothetical protein